MASRKFLDLTGLGTLVNNIKTLLTGKQDTLTQGSNITISGNTISATDTTYDNATTSAAGLMSAADKTKLDNTFKELTSPVQIWDLSDGVYQLPKSCQVYYGGSTHDVNKMFTVYTPSLLWVTHYNSTYKHFFIFYGDTSTYRYIRNGYATSSDGSYDTLTFGGSSYLRSISNYVKNNLTYSTSSTTYALSAYQGYLLNQNKADKTEIPTTTSKLTNDSGFISSTDGEVIKQLADGNINIWTLDDGIYSLPTTGYIYYDPDDNTKRVQIGSGGLLLIDKQDNNTNKYVLYMNRIIMYGMTDTIGGMSAATVNTCQSIQNKVTSISSSSTDTQYPSAKAVYDFAGEHYSTTERVIGTWIDGKPLYQKVITGTLQDFTTTTLNNDILVDTNATNVIVKAAQSKRTNGNVYPFANTIYQADFGNELNKSIGLSYSIRNNNTIRITQQDSSNNGATYTVIVCYTKTTD